MTHYVYIPITGENKISTFILNPDTGQLTFQRDIATSGAPGPLAINPESKFLYVGIRSTREIASFSIDPSTGDLSPIGSVSLEADPCYISTDGKGNFLLSAYYGAGATSVHPIGEGRSCGRTRHRMAHDSEQRALHHD